MTRTGLSGHSASAVSWQPIVAVNAVITAKAMWRTFHSRLFSISCRPAYHNAFSSVMAGLVPAIHVLLCVQGVDARHIGERSDAVLRTAKAGHGAERVARRKLALLRSFHAQHLGDTGELFAKLLDAGGELCRPAKIDDLSGGRKLDGD